MMIDTQNSGIFNVLIVASITFVAYEGFQLVVNAVSEMTNPDKNIPRAIYAAISLAVLIYVVISLCFGYWYWMRPIRRPQFHYAYTWWSEIAKDYGLPLPSDEMYE